ncbi:MAG: transglutaminase-like domain-containing protein, partial [Planctomycetota bacterium]
MGGARVGYARTTISHARRSGRKVVRVEGLTHLAVKRFGQMAEQEIRFTCIETLDGKLIEFEAEVQQGKVPMRSTGKVVGNRLQLETTTLGKKTSTSIPWSSEYGGFYATEESLLRRPMQPGERRTIRSLVPVLNQVATIELVAKDYELVKLLGGSFELLRIDTTTRFSGGVELSVAVWCDRQGESLKTRTDAIQLETVRATKALALETKDLAEIDLGWDATVTVDRRLESPHSTKQIRYRVQLDGADPAKVFVSGPSQRVKSTGPHTAELTVYALRPGQTGGNPEAPDDPPSDEHQEPNNMIQSDYPKIVAMARKAAGDRQDPWQVAQTLERYVGQHISEVAFSEAFATAAEVAENPVGDCTEHAVLLAALARARGIPARAAMGLVYIQGKGSFGYHMWTEVYVEGRWIPIDATL